MLEPLLFGERSFGLLSKNDTIDKRVSKPSSWRSVHRGR